jgi:hypothetical protein
MAGVLGLIRRGQSPGPRFKNLRSRAPRARPSLRRALLHRRADHPDLLPPHLSGEACQVAQRRVLPDRGRCGAGGLPPVPAVSARDGAGNPGMARGGGVSQPGAPAHRARISRRRQDGGRSRRRAGHDDPSPAPAVRPSRWRGAARGGYNPEGPARKAAGRRDHDADVRGRVRRRVREHPALQRSISGGVSEGADRDSPGRSPTPRRPNRGTCLGVAARVTAS